MNRKRNPYLAKNLPDFLIIHPLWEIRHIQRTPPRQMNRHLLPIDPFLIFRERGRDGFAF